MKIRAFVASVLAFVLLTLSSTAFAQTRFGVVDLARVANESAEGIRIEANLKKLREAREAEIQKRQQEVQKRLGALEAAAATLDRAAFQKQYLQIMKDAQDVQKDMLGAQRELEKQRSEAFASLKGTAQKAAQRIAEQDRLDGVFDRAGVVVTKSMVDITDRCIALMGAPPAAK